MGGRYRWIAALGMVALLVFVLFVPAQCRIIRPGERGVVATWGKIEPVAWSEGLHVKRAFSQKVYRVDVKVQKIQVEVGAASKDLQEVKSEIAVNYHLDPGKVNELIRQIGRDFNRILIQPAIAEMVKAATAKYTAEELITKRESVKNDIKVALGARLAMVFVLVDEVSIVNFDFSEGFNRAIEEKQTAAQNAIKAERDLVRIKVEAEQRVAQARADAEAKVLNAKAEAESLALQRQVLSPDLLSLRTIERWDGRLPTYMGNGPVPFLDLK